MDMGGQIEDEAAAGLLPVDNAGLLGIIKDEESCQDSDFSGDDKDLGTAGQNANEELPSHGALRDTQGAPIRQPGGNKTSKNQGDKAQSNAQASGSHKAEHSSTKMVASAVAATEKAAGAISSTAGGAKQGSKKGGGGGKE